ncbi:MAG TPA: hypothetical protein DHU55_02945 [Blastocatellia bacterium]|nr:hypothetical protein [Blastocatellia bacterium]
MDFTTDKPGSYSVGANIMLAEKLWLHLSRFADCLDAGGEQTRFMNAVRDASRQISLLQVVMFA